MRTIIFTLAALALNTAYATGLATCESGDPSSWQSKDVLKETLIKAGWEVRLIKEDDGCYEVYALDENKARTEAYFHPVTLKRVTLQEKR